MKKSYYAMIAVFALAFGLILKGFIMNEDIKLYLVIFFAVGNGLGLLRLFVNNSIKKMKGKPIAVKILFFAVLLGVGIPFQNWFRVNVMFSMQKSYLPFTITMMVCGAVFMTIFSGYLKDRKAKKLPKVEVEDKEVA